MTRRLLAFVGSASAASPTDRVAGGAAHIGDDPARAPGGAQRGVLEPRGSGLGLQFSGILGRGSTECPS